MAEIIGKRYLILKQIGKGGMADVFLAQDMILKREVAIKVLHGDLSSDAVALERFHREAGASTSLTHPNIVDIYDVGEDNKKYYIVMEYVKGHTLKQLIQKRGPIPVREAVWLMKQLSSALQEAHNNGIIHRDIKSQNVLIKADGTVKLSDFGIALANDAMQITSKDAVLGSVHYLAPECAKGHLANIQSDIYSLGIVFYEILMGDIPFKGDQPVKIAMQHIRNEIPSIKHANPELPQSVENIILKATCKNTQQRYKTVRDMLKDLEVCLNPDHKNDSKIILKSILPEEKKKEQKKIQKKNVWIYRFSLVGLVAFALLMIISILYLSGVIGKRSRNVRVPELTGLSVIEAQDVLNAVGLTIDYHNIERVMTENIEAGKIISYSPDKETEIEQGARVHIVVSNGIYAVTEDYTGKNIHEVKALLQKAGIIVEETAIASDRTPGTILQQEGLLPGEKYNPNVRNVIRLKYSQYPTMLIPFKTLGRSVESVRLEFEEKGFAVSVEYLDPSVLSEKEKSYGEGNVVRISPSEGTSYRQEGNEKIVLYSY